MANHLFFFSSNSIQENIYRTKKNKTIFADIFFFVRKLGLMATMSTFCSAQLFKAGFEA